MRDTVTIPWPDKALSPNARTHWSVKAKAAKSYRKACWALALQAKLKVNWDGPIYLTLIFCPPTNRARDDDNLLASLKAGRDGLADALKIDDKRFTVRKIEIGSVTPNGMVRVWLERGAE